jgi:hypothetical protein
MSIVFWILKNGEDHRYFIASADLSRVRFMMDVLLEVYLGKLILLFPLEFISSCHLKEI